MKKLLLGLVVLLSASVARAEGYVPTAPETKAKQAILVDAHTGTVLFAKDADLRMPTSSMSKIMTLYLVFEALRDGRFTLSDNIQTSEYAWKQEGSRMFLNPGEPTTLENMIRGVVIQSGNDASVALAEAVGGSEGNFAAKMNEKARVLGMTNSHFVNATGLPHPDHYSTARDLATLAIAIQRDFPQYYHYFAEKEFTYNKIKQGNRNPLLYRNIGVDGIKTGHTEAAGFGLVGSSLRDNRRMVLVVNGLGSMQERADEPAKLLDWGYLEYGLYPVVKANAVIAEAKTWLGQQPSVQLLAGKDVLLTLPRSSRNQLVANYTYDQPIKAPIQKGQTVGKMTVTAPGLSTIEVPLIAANDVAEMGFFAKIGAKISMLLSDKK